MRRLAIVFIAALLQCPTATSWGQGGVNGSITGAVYDQTGQPIKGVKVGASSDTQIGGTKITYTDDDGTFRFVALQPGTFSVTATAPKLKTLHQKGIRVGVTTPAEVILLMDVETQVEEVKVVERAPVVSTTSATVKEVYDEEFIDSLPLDSRYGIESFVAHNTPGVYHVGSEGTRSFKVRGGDTRQNAFYLEGFTMSRQEVTPKSLATVEVQTAGYGAEYANVPGGVMNLVSKSGSNRYELDISGFVEHSSFAFFKDASDPDGQSLRMLVNPAFSGPIIKDRLWFYLNTEMRHDLDPRESDETGLLPRAPTRKNYNPRVSAKLTWQMTPRNKLQSYSNFNYEFARNNVDPKTYELDAQSERLEYAYFNGLTWESLLTARIFLKLQAGAGRSFVGSRPIRCVSEPDVCDHIPQVVNTLPRTIRLQNYQSHDFTVEQTFEVAGTLEWFAHSKMLGDHDVRLKSRFYVLNAEDVRSTPGDRIITLAGSNPEREQVFFANDPRNDSERYGWYIKGTQSLLTTHSLSDTMRLTRHLTVSPGVALTTSRAKAAGDGTQFDQKSISPSLSTAWDATHDGRTVLRASFSRYVDTSALYLANFASGSQVTRTCLWNEDSGAFDRNCLYGGGRSNFTFGLPCGPAGVDERGQTCQEALKMPTTWEYTVGGEREIIPGVGLGLDLVYRLYTAQYEQRETNRVWDGAGQTLVPSGNFRNGRTEIVNDMGTIGRRRYIAVTGALHKREGALKASTSYTWSKLEGYGINRDSNLLGENPARDLLLWGPLEDDARHQVRTSLSYRLTPWFSFGLVYRYVSGRPYNRFFRNEVLGGFSDLRAQRGIDPGNNINDPGDDRPLRLPDIQQVNLQVRVNMKPMTGVNFEGYVDAINVLALRTATTFYQENTATFGQTQTRMRPFQLRLGFRYRY